MKLKINLRDVPVQHQQWGDGRYDRRRKHVSEALSGRVPSGDPFDVEITTVAPGCFNCPQHTHTRNAEFFIILSGSGIAYHNDTEVPIEAGDCFMRHPGTSHHLHNLSTTEDLTFIVISQDHADDAESIQNP
ncbi:cupin domain-containing protein [Prosthecobacter sp.]|uniref:cupin domain-containing protein n=1 Tax=Prosthecobacter sp. TaxID=1965333 RepID=UPI0037848F1B